ncbi:hypothetical protein TNCV_1894491 [Trichonephila clavipes]|nr:hypothetical protein TNCV_1894491 [Trichonephila clavipes]
MSSFLLLREGDNRNRWRDGQVCPDVGQGIMAPWTRRPGRRKKMRERSPTLGMEKREKPCPGSRKHEKRVLVGTDWRRALRSLEWKGRKERL